MRFALRETAIIIGANSCNMYVLLYKSSLRKKIVVEWLNLKIVFQYLQRGGIYLC